MDEKKILKNSDNEKLKSDLLKKKKALLNKEIIKK